MARTDPQVNLRLAVDLKAKLELAARSNHRTLTAEVADRLARSFEDGARLTDQDVARIADAVAAKLANK